MQQATMSAGSDANASNGNYSGSYASPGLSSSSSASGYSQPKAKTKAKTATPSSAKGSQSGGPSYNGDKATALSHGNLSSLKGSIEAKRDTSNPANMAAPLTAWSDPTKGGAYMGDTWRTTSTYTDVGGHGEALGSDNITALTKAAREGTATEAQKAAIADIVAGKNDATGVKLSGGLLGSMLGGLVPGFGGLGLALGGGALADKAADVTNSGRGGLYAASRQKAGDEQTWTGRAIGMFGPGPIGGLGQAMADSMLGDYNGQVNDLSSAATTGGILQARNFSQPPSSSGNNQPLIPKVDPQADLQQQQADLLAPVNYDWGNYTFYSGI